MVGFDPDLLTICGIDEFWEMVRDPARPLARYAMVYSSRPVLDPTQVPLLAEHGYTARQLFFDYPDFYQTTYTKNCRIEHVRSVIDEARMYRGQPLLFQCRVGKSRSAANALAVVADTLGVGAEAEAVSIINALRPICVPNPLIAMQADMVLGRQGALLEALFSNPYIAERYPNYVKSVRARTHHFITDRPDLAATLLIEDNNQLQQYVGDPAYAHYQRWMERYTKAA